jgi:hypothetical protein
MHQFDTDFVYFTYFFALEYIILRIISVILRQMPVQEMIYCYNDNDRVNCLA